MRSFIGLYRLALLCHAFFVYQVYNCVIFNQYKIKNFIHSFIQRYKNQNIARNWAIYPNLDRKIQSCFLCLKIGTHGSLEVLIPNSYLDFGNSETKIHFWANLGRKN